MERNTLVDGMYALDSKAFWDTEQERIRISKEVLKACRGRSVELIITDQFKDCVKARYIGCIENIRGGILNIWVDSEFQMPMTMTINIPLQLVERLRLDTHTGLLELWVVDAGDLCTFVK